MAKRHHWKGGICVDCGLHREGAGAGPYGSMRYYRKNDASATRAPGPCTIEMSANAALVRAEVLTEAADSIERGFGPESSTGARVAIAALREMAARYKRFSKEGAR